MDKEPDEIQSLNFFGIFVESFTIVLSWKKLFTQISIATIFPFSLIFFVHVLISELFFSEIVHSREEISFTNPKIAFLSFKMAYAIFFLVLSLVSTSTVVYTVARICTRKEISFGEAMSVIPKVWKRLMDTFAWSLITIFAYNMATLSLLFPWLGSMARIEISGPLFVMYVMGFVYISIIWQLAIVVSVLEEDCGIEAMIKGRKLIKGKMVISAAVFLLLNLGFVLIRVVFERFVVLGGLFWTRVWCGILCFLFLSGFTLLGLVIQTVIYLVCKSYHYGIVGKPCLANHFEVYLGDYTPLRSKDVQLDQC